MWFWRIIFCARKGQPKAQRKRAAKNNPSKSLTPPPTKNQNRLSGQMARNANGGNNG
jgi:hypothetical protein